MRIRTDTRILDVPWPGQELRIRAYIYKVHTKDALKENSRPYMETTERTLQPYIPVSRKRKARVTSTAITEAKEKPNLVSKREQVMHMIGKMDTIN